MMQSVGTQNHKNKWKSFTFEEIVTEARAITEWGRRRRKFLIIASAGADDGLECLNKLRRPLSATCRLSESCKQLVISIISA